MSWEAEYKTALREFLTVHGIPVKFRDENKTKVSEYDWNDMDAMIHAGNLKSWGQNYQAEELPCKWVVPEGSIVSEQAYYMWEGTGYPGSDEVGINVSGCHCVCGKYTDMTLRYVDSLSAVMRVLIGKPLHIEMSL